jgi:hypothetical protein
LHGSELRERRPGGLSSDLGWVTGLFQKRLENEGSAVFGMGGRVDQGQKALAASGTQKLDGPVFVLQLIPVELLEFLPALRGRAFAERLMQLGAGGTSFSQRSSLACFSSRSRGQKRSTRTRNPSSGEGFS